MADHVLITGGSGMIGRHLIPLLEDQGYEVGILSRKSNVHGPVKSWAWDINKNSIDPESISFADHIIHLAGVNTGEKKWSAARKKEIMDSRVKTAELLYNQISATGKKLKTFISASGSTFYGWNTGSILVNEDRNKPGDDFLAVVTKEWESSANKIKSLGIRTVIFRNGPVLSLDGVFLKKIIPVVKSGLAAGIGNGDQYISWIHINDLCRLFIFALKEDSLEGTFNAVSPAPVTNKELMKAIANAMHKPFFLPNVPAFIMRLMYGEMSSMILGSNRVSSEKIEARGFTFEHKNINEALNDLLKK